MNKFVAFVSGYCLPLTLALLAHAIADGGWSRSLLRVLIPAMLLFVLGATGFHIFTVRARLETMRYSELVVRGVVAGAIFLCWCITAFSFFRSQWAVHVGLALSVCLAPLALIISTPHRR